MVDGGEEIVSVGSAEGTSEFAIEQSTVHHIVIISKSLNNKE